MNLPSLPLKDGALYIDASGWIENLCTCHRKLQYSQLNQRIKADDAVALTFGTADHISKELRYQVYGTEKVTDQYWSDLGVLLTHHFSANPTPLDDWRNQNWAMELMRHYLKRYSTEEFSLLEYDQPQPCSWCHGGGSLLWNPTKIKCPFCNGSGKVKRMVELTFAVMLYDHTTLCGYLIPIIYSGRIDLPISLHGKLFITDHKTSSFMGATVFDQLHMSDQQKGYCWAFQETTGQKVVGYMPNVTRSKEPPQYVLEGKEFRGKSQSPEKWWEESFQRDYHYLGEGELEEWKNNTIAKMEEFFWNYNRGYLPMEHTACTRFGKCQYYDVCSIYPPSERSKFLFSELFKDNTWSPLHL